MEKYLEQFESCWETERPFCSNTCPFHMDVLDFQFKMSKNRYNAAFRTFRNAVGFPDIAAALCPEYCAESCLRRDIDQSVQLNLLEKTCVARAVRKDPTDYNVPSKTGRAAVIGAGISGLACALRLASKKYDVTIYEKTGRLGGKLWDLLPEDLFLVDIRRQFRFEKYELHLDTEITDIEELVRNGFDAVYIATGEGGMDFGTADNDEGNCSLCGNTAIFAGGSLTGRDIIRAMADGLDMAWAIEVFLKTRKIEYPHESRPSNIVVADQDAISVSDPAEASDDGIFTDEEAAREAARCIRCSCDACKKYCDLMTFYNKGPIRIRDDTVSTVASSISLVHKTPARRLVNACTQCGLCAEVCVSDIDIGGMMKEARRMLHRQDKMPGGYHQFWLEDMDFSNGSYAAVVRTPPGREKCGYAFFPGCQLGAADPGHVIKIYQWLLSERPDTGLMLRCCGIPADWAGNEKMHNEELDNIRSDWEKMGEPVLIAACPSCMKHLTEYLPEIRIVSLYEMMELWDIPLYGSGDGRTYSIFDPCSARNNETLQHAVRSIVRKAGTDFEELPGGDRHGCCGYGGQGSLAEPAFAGHVAQSRSSLSANPYITYCINCRDVFISEEKPAVHILDLVYGKDHDSIKLPDLSQRRRNRTALKEALLKEIWNEEMSVKPDKCRYELRINTDIRRKMNRLKILEEDLCKVIEYGEKAGRRTFDPERGTYKSYRELGSITCWAEYRMAGQAYEIVNVYSHRMKIVLEAVWNGKKTDADL